MSNWTTRIYRKEDKIYRGAFIFSRNENTYADESFDVYRDKKELTFHYISEAIIRVTTGEILKINVEYIVNKDYHPLYVYIEKNMGKESSMEIFEYHSKRSTLTYHFKNSKGEEASHELTTAPRFHIATPTAATSMLFIRSKKFDAGGKNHYNSLLSFNHWEFKEDPKFKGIVVERASLTSEKMNIDGQNVQAIQYKVYDENVDVKASKEPPHIKCFMSPHGSIPYLIRTEDGTKIQIKYLNDLSERD